ncbi:MAG: BACON domain-containing protein [Prevotella sp.]|nr:BACON domain-containing protein [Prevotella sp.]
MKLITKLILSLLFVCFSVAVNAQSAGDRLFAQGQKFQMTQTVKAQRQAIAKFEAAKKAYDSAAKKQMCDNQIAICNSNIKTIANTKKTYAKKPKEKEEKTEGSGKMSFEPAPDMTPVELYFSISSVEFKAKAKKNDIFKVVVNCNYDDWTYTHPKWIKVAQNGNTLILTAEQNKGKDRSDVLTVTCKDTKAELVIYQKGAFLKNLF